MTEPRDVVADQLAGFALFADLSAAQLAEVALAFEEAWFGDGERILRQGLSAAGLFVIAQGEALVRVDGEERARLGRGDFFGEVSVLLGEAPVADVVAAGPLRCLVLPTGAVQSFLLRHPAVMFRMLQVLARRLRSANRWRS